LPSTTVVYELDNAAGVWRVVFSFSNRDAREWIGGGELVYFNMERLNTLTQPFDFDAEFQSISIGNYEDVLEVSATCTVTSSVQCETVPTR